MRRIHWAIGASALAMLAVEARGDADPGLLELQVHVGTGVVRIVGNDLEPVAFTGYEISSEAGSLVPEDWLSFEDQGRPGWMELVDPPTEFVLAEGTLGDPELVDASGMPELGAAFDITGARDLEFIFTVDSGDPENDVRSGTVAYIIPEPSTVCFLVAAGGVLLTRRPRQGTVF